MSKILRKIDEKGSELLVNFIYMLFGAFAIVVSYIFYFLTSSTRR